ncbi:hypothetical protein [Burkholderia ubonensis]|uniref:hypothetical protein n=1 Tax=Burkholderia ubonensis TaxID=101571 RepID=UPI00075222C8|nr:hypothetical protein [Burkholderia ubonensis]KVO88517.1 hypothetical protein WJ80_07680 [Burkholderia ubonensis]
MNKTFRSANQLHAELLACITLAGESRAEYIAAYGDQCDSLIPYLTGTLRVNLPELAAALANAAGMGHLNESREARAK